MYDTPQSITTSHAQPLLANATKISTLPDLRQHIHEDGAAAEHSIPNSQRGTTKSESPQAESLVYSVPPSNGGTPLPAVDPFKKPALPTKRSELSPSLRRQYTIGTQASPSPEVPRRNGNSKTTSKTPENTNPVTLVSSAKALAGNDTQQGGHQTARRGVFEIESDIESTRDLSTSPKGKRARSLGVSAKKSLPPPKFKLGTASGTTSATQSKASTPQRSSGSSRVENHTKKQTIGSNVEQNSSSENAGLKPEERPIAPHPKINGGADSQNLDPARGDNSNNITKAETQGPIRADNVTPTTNSSGTPSHTVTRNTKEGDDQEGGSESGNRSESDSDTESDSSESSEPSQSPEKNANPIKSPVLHNDDRQQANGTVNVSEVAKLPQSGLGESDKHGKPIRREQLVTKHKEELVETNSKGALPESLSGQSRSLKRKAAELGEGRRRKSQELFEAATAGINNVQEGAIDKVRDRDAQLHKALQDEREEIERQSGIPVVAVPRTSNRTPLTPFIPGSSSLRPALVNGRSSSLSNGTPPRTSLPQQANNTNGDSSNIKPRRSVSFAESHISSPEPDLPNTPQVTAKRGRKPGLKSTIGSEKLSTPAVSVDKDEVPTPRTKARNDRMSFLNALRNMRRGSPDVEASNSHQADPGSGGNVVETGGGKEAAVKTKDGRPLNGERHKGKKKEGVAEDEEGTGSSEEGGEEGEEAQDTVVLATKPEINASKTAREPKTATATKGNDPQKKLVSENSSGTTRQLPKGKLQPKGAKAGTPSTASTTKNKTDTTSQPKARTVSRSSAKGVVSDSDSLSKPETDSASSSESDQEENHNDDMEVVEKEKAKKNEATAPRENHKKWIPGRKELPTEAKPSKAAATSFKEKPPVTKSKDAITEHTTSEDSASEASSDSSSTSSDDDDNQDEEEDVDLPPIKPPPPSTKQPLPPKQKPNSNSSNKDESAKQLQLEDHKSRSSFQSSQPQPPAKGLASSSQSQPKTPSTAATNLSSSQRYPTFSGLRGASNSNNNTGRQGKGVTRPSGSRQLSGQKPLLGYKMPGKAAAVTDDDDDSDSDEESSESESGEEEGGAGELPGNKTSGNGGKGVEGGYYRRGLRGLLKGMWFLIALSDSEYGWRKMSKSIWLTFSCAFSFAREEDLMVTRDRSATPEYSILNTKGQEFCPMKRGIKAARRIFGLGISGEQSAALCKSSHCGGREKHL